LPALPLSGVVAKQVSFCDRAWLRLGRVIGYVYDGNGEVFPAVVQAFSIARIAPSTRYRIGLVTVETAQE